MNNSIYYDKIEYCKLNINKYNQIFYDNLCNEAEISLKVTTNMLPNIYIFSDNNFKSFYLHYDYKNFQTNYYINRSKFKNSKEILEYLAYNVFDYIARETLKLNNRNLKRIYDIKDKKITLHNDTINEEWNKILNIIKKLSLQYDEIVFINNIAIYLHLYSKDEQNLLETSYDIDMYTSFLDFSNIRNDFQVYTNKRLQKAETIIDNISVDIYVEHNHSLIIPYNELKEYSQEIEGINVACPEHLLILKYQAYKDRKNSNKGFKDLRDIINIIYVMTENINKDIILCYLDDNDIDEIRKIINNNKNYLSITNNRRYIKQLSQEVKENFKKIENISLNNSDISL